MMLYEIVNELKINYYPSIARYTQQALELSTSVRSIANEPNRYNLRTLYN